MNLSLLASLLLLVWLLLPCLLGPAALNRLCPPAATSRVERSQPASVTLARLYGRPLPPLPAKK